MANHGAERQTFTGQVIKANDTGVILDTMPDTWLNRSSKGAAAALELPRAGQQVSIEATPWKDRWYIGSVTVHPNGHSPAGENEHAPQGRQDAPNVSQEPDRERRITRMACLNTAATVLSHNLTAGECIKADVLEALAGRLEAWVYRPVPTAAP